MHNLNSRRLLLICLVKYSDKLFMAACCVVSISSLFFWSRVVQKKPLVAQAANKFHDFYEGEGLFPCWQERVIGPYPKPNESSPHCHEIDFNIILYFILLQMVSSCQVFRSDFVCIL
jgi:hypothetical protein